MSNTSKITRLTDCFELSNGVKIPCIGLGTWQTDHETTINAVVSAVKSGYRLIDTAAAYGNEASVGTGIRESGIDRKDIFITSKLRNAHHGYESTLEAFERTIARLGVDYLDLYLIHWPNPLHYRSIGEKATAATWKAFEELYRAKKIRAIGVSNFMPHHIDALMKTAEILPMVNQLRLCPGVKQPEIVKYCQEKGILVEAYSPLGTGAIFDVPEMKSLAEKYGKSIGQICLRWSLQMGFLSLPKSKSSARIKENTEIFDFELSEEDMVKIGSMEGCCGSAPDPDTVNY